MPTRTRTTGARVPPTGRTPRTVDDTVVITGTFKSPKSPYYSYTGGGVINDVAGSFTDNRQSIVDVTGNRLGVNNVTHGKTVVSYDHPGVAMFVQKNPSSPFGTARTNLYGNTVCYWMDRVMGSPHLSLSNGASIAQARVPNTSPELLSGLNSLYELKDCRAFLELIPTHLLWAVARRKRADSVRELHKWLSDMKSIVKSPLGILQAVTGADLMWKFGVAPLIRDVHSVNTALDRIVTRMQEMAQKPFTVAGRYTETTSKNDTHQDLQAGATLAFYSSKVTTRRTTTTTWVYGARKRLDTTKLPSFDYVQHALVTESLGLGIDVTDVWEAVPYSFVIDWFLPVQTFLEQMEQATPDPSWVLTEAAWTSNKTVTQGSTTEVITPLSNANCVLSEATGLTRFGTFSRTDYSRTKLASLPTWNPNIYIPRPKLPSLGEGFTGIELLLQRIKRTLK